MADVLKVDVWSDIACPWCYLGSRRFAEGVRRYEEAGGGRRVVVELHSFELAPDTPVDFEGSEVDFLVRHKGMAPEQVRTMLDDFTAMAAAEGLEYAFGSVRHTKTLAAHAVLHLAKARGVQAAVAERLFAAYFTQGRHVGRVEDLADLAAEAGLDRAEVVAALTEGTYDDDVAADIAQARAYGISGVPFFVIDGRYGVSGAQSPEVFARALEQASQDAPA